MIMTEYKCFNCHSKLKEYFFDIKRQFSCESCYKCIFRLEPSLKVSAFQFLITIDDVEFRLKKYSNIHPVELSNLNSVLVEVYLDLEFKDNVPQVFKMFDRLKNLIAFS